nr:MAG TPA: hypothetical protein [Caudoviricetes sp.]
MWGWKYTRYTLFTISNEYNTVLRGIIGVRVPHPPPIKTA